MNIFLIVFAAKICESLKEEANKDQTELVSS